MKLLYIVVTNIKIMKKHLFLLLIFSSLFAQAQNSYVPALITTTKNEQLNYFVKVSLLNGGLINYINEPNLLDKKASNYILVKFEKNDKDSDRLSLNDIKSVKLKDAYYEKLYVQHPSSMSETDLLVPRIIVGKINLFKYDHLLNGTMPKTIYYLQQDGVLFKVRRRGFKKEMAYYFKGVPALAEQIKSGKLQYKDIATIVSKYNHNQSQPDAENVYFQE